MSTSPDTLKTLFITGAVNLHAVEKQALSIMTPQIARIEHYPEIADRLQAHIEETNAQIGRLDEILATFDTSGSVLKDAGLSFTGSMAAISHSVAGDEILKNSFANYAFEHFEIAAYKSLREEQSMAQWIDEALPMITRRYASLYADGGASTAKV
jgi:ferritin-like metal-binding protein YciE